MYPDVYLYPSFNQSCIYICKFISNKYLQPNRKMGKRLNKLLTKKEIYDKYVARNSMSLLTRQIQSKTTENAIIYTLVLIKLKG